uniref:Uncharacterized protein n=1 Tax=Stegastes partitus TaxID=144197 RepID=A0A3B4ZXM2_9TELE
LKTINTLMLTLFVLAECTYLLSATTMQKKHRMSRRRKMWAGREGLPLNPSGQSLLLWLRPLQQFLRHWLRNPRCQPGSSKTLGCVRNHPLTPYSLLTT